MTLLLRQLFKLAYLLNSEKGTASISAGFACGLVLGFSPVLSLQSLLVFLVILVFKVQFAAALLAAAGFKLLSLPLTPIFHSAGNFVLGLDFLEPLYTSLYNLPLIPLTRFYDTVVMGAGVVSLLLAYPVYRLTEFLVDRYRSTVLAWLKESRLWSVWKASTLYKWYQKYESFSG
jgi:uncharacterized protein (TIGR03546 family)